jgi:hypothetical protein
MKPVLTVAALGAGIGFAIAHAPDATSATDFRHDIQVIASEVASSLIRGIILGVNIGAYPSGLIPAHIQSRLTASEYAPAQSTDSNSGLDEMTRLYALRWADPVGVR